MNNKQKIVWQLKNKVYTGAVIAFVPKAVTSAAGLFVVPHPSPPRDLLFDDVKI